MSYDPLDPRGSTGDSPHEERFPRGLVIRLFAYLIAGHIIAGFLYLLFLVGGQNQ
ncbi:DUF6126 family protein [Streptomyces xantholiticus]|uniref:DUF6126 family protein n=1 Tax=Streptomyces xantholiticus TaxID=68285 RepID=A0ABV1UTZ0_9ACTN